MWWRVRNKQFDVIHFYHNYIFNIFSIYQVNIHPFYSLLTLQNHIFVIL